VQEQDTPTQFIGGIGKRMLDQLSSNGKIGTTIKLLPWILFLLTALLLMTDRWIGTTEKAVVSADRIERLEKSYVRSDVLEARMSSFEKRQNEMKAQLDQIQMTLTTLLVEQRRK
jgi:hypothetical protein